MTHLDIKHLIERIQRWPDVARDELLAVADQIESELRSDEYVASGEELEILDAAAREIDSANNAGEADIQAAFARFLKK
jgi:hypothetical protein